MRGSRTGRPVMALLDLLGRRMALRILWELSRADAPLTFRALQGAADTNPALLNTRLKELRAAGLVVHGGDVDVLQLLIGDRPARHAHPLCEAPRLDERAEPVGVGRVDVVAAGD